VGPTLYSSPGVGFRGNTTHFYGLRNVSRPSELMSMVQTASLSIVRLPFTARYKLSAFFLAHRVLSINTTALIYLKSIYRIQNTRASTSTCPHMCILQRIWCKLSVMLWCCGELFHLQPLSAPAAVLPLYRSTLERRSEGQTRRVWSAYRPVPLQNNCCGT
jgi:hypothetical protein